MRIVAKIATAGVAGLSRFPVPNATIEECLTPDGRLDEYKARHALNCDQVQIGSKDDRRVIAFTMEYLKQMRSVVEHLAERVGPDAASVDDEKGFRTSAATKNDRRCERNMKRGRRGGARSHRRNRGGAVRPDAGRRGAGGRGGLTGRADWRGSDARTP